MTPAGFRRIALSLPEACEGSHMEHPDFRLRNRIFATLWPDGKHGVVIVTPNEQSRLMAASPEAFTPVKGGWGRRGSTQVQLDLVDESLLKDALESAWKRIAPKRLQAASGLTFE